MSLFRRSQVPQPISSLVNLKNISHSVSTEESPRPQGKPNKQKSQLCKKFVEQGFCPYHNKCKFAHGLHELKKNCQTNSKYKTKQCGGFVGQGFCPYGNRCNFIHPSNDKKGVKARDLQIQILLIVNEGNKQSRLLNILKY